MTKKDYILIAGVVKNVKMKHEVFVKNPKKEIGAIRVLSTHLSHELGKENPRFDGERFLLACGFGEETTK